MKVPAAQPEQLGFEGLFLPTAVLDPQRGPVSAYPDTTLPRAVLTAFTGDLGIDDGVAAVGLLARHARPDPGRGDGGQPLAQSLAPGQRWTCRTAGSITFDGVRRWATLQVAHDPGTGPALVAAVLALAGLMLSLFVRRRRVWVRVAARRRRAYARRGRRPGPHRRGRTGTRWPRRSPTRSRGRSAAADRTRGGT